MWVPKEVAPNVESPKRASKGVPQRWCQNGSPKGMVSKGGRRAENKDGPTTAVLNGGQRRVPHKRSPSG